MKKYTRIGSLGLLFGLVLLLALAIQVQAGPEPPFTPVEAPHLSMGQEQMVQAVSAPATAGSPASDSAAVPCIGGACPATVISCNTVVNWVNDRPNQWNTYNCLDASIFTTGVPYSETFYSVSISTPHLDLSLAIPKSITHPVTLEDMDNFGAILGACNSDACQSGHATHVIDREIKQHAIVSDAPTQVYTISIDSPNMDGSGDAIIACGSHDTGWCEDPGVISTTFQCGNFTFHDNANNGKDDITYYGTNVAFDGKEMTYRLVLTESRYVSATLHYAGNLSDDYAYNNFKGYNNYMGLFLLPDTCNQRTLLGYTGLTGETGPTSRSMSPRWLPPGTYYLVADGIHMPYGGDPFRVDMGCSGLEASKEAEDLNGDRLYPGDVVEYTVVLRNTGGLALSGVGVVDNIPADTTYVAGSAATTPAVTVIGPDPLVATWASIGAGQTVTLTFRVTVDATAVGKTIANSVTASTPQYPNLTQAGNLIGPVRAPVEVRKEVAAAGGKEEVEAGDTITYTITVNNPDTVSANYAMTDTLSSYVTYVPGSGVPAPCSVTAGTLCWQGQTIGPGEVKVYTFEATVGDVPEDEVIENVVWLAQVGRDPISTSVKGPAKPASFVYLPIVLKNYK